MKKVVKDDGLILAVSRYAGADIHALFWLVDRYIEACEKDQVEYSNAIAIQIRRRLVKKSYEGVNNQKFEKQR